MYEDGMLRVELPLARGAIGAGPAVTEQDAGDRGRRQ